MTFVDLPKKYTMYILRCADGTLYTGICTDPPKRLHEHNHTTRGAKYTKTRRPVTYIYQEICANRSEALKREYVVRHLSHNKKGELAARWKK